MKIFLKETENESDRPCLKHSTDPGRFDVCRACPLKQAMLNKCKK